MAAATTTTTSTAPPLTNNDGKRVKVYELKNNDWYDRGTGFCAGSVVSSPSAPPEQLDARIFVTSEEDPSRRLLETRITKDDGYQKQQETLIVWTETNGVDMALSFQEAEGCAMIWEFVSDVQLRLVPEDAISDDLLDPVHSSTLPEPELGRLDEVENAIRHASSVPAAREPLVRYMLSGEQPYILKLGRLVTVAEEAESLPDLHKLCVIMKLLILMNDSAIIENIVTDEAIMGVLGALEYDPEFPSHRANHRQYISDSSKFKEVVKIKNDDIRHKIHYTYRLLYLKDVVLARILDDPTFSVLNSLIFFHQVDIVNHLQADPEFLNELFAIWEDKDSSPARQKDAVLFIQNCCAVSKNIQPPPRAQLYQNFIAQGLIAVLTLSLRNHDPAVRVAATDILVSMIDHDVHMVRAQVFKSINQRTVPLIDSLIELVLAETDLGVKSQLADAIKILVDPYAGSAAIEMMNRQGNSEMLSKQRMPQQHGLNGATPQTTAIITRFYEKSAAQLFQPLKDLEHRKSMFGLSIQETSLFTHLVEMLGFFIRVHEAKATMFILTENLHSRVARLLSCPQKFMKLIALKFFRTCVLSKDEFHHRQIIQNRLFEPILDIVYETMPRDNLLNSTCLEFFESIKRDAGAHRLIFTHLVEQYRARLLGITYVETFHGMVLQYDRMLHEASLGANGEGNTSFTTEENTPDAVRTHTITNGRQIFSGLHEPDPEEDAYFNGDEDFDGELGDDDDVGLPSKTLINGASPIRRLVDYPDDDDDDEPMDILASSPDPFRDSHVKQPSSSSSSHNKDASSSDPANSINSTNTPPSHDSPLETRGRSRRQLTLHNSPPSPSETSSLAPSKRRRPADDDDDDDDALGKLMGAHHSKRRNSSTASRHEPSHGNSISHSSHNNNDVPQSAQSPSTVSSDDPVYSTKSSESSHAITHGHALRRKNSLKARHPEPDRSPIAGKSANATTQKSSTVAGTANRPDGGGTKTESDDGGDKSGTGDGAG